MYANAILGLTAQTSIHAGASGSEEAIDLPIQRESHTDWPVVFGSGVKGALRGHFELSWKDDKKHNIIDIFGPDTNNGSAHAGALMVTDARLVLLPVRSLTSHVKWVTCPALLQRYFRDCQRMQRNISAVDTPDYSILQDYKNALIPESDNNSGLHVYLEEFRYQTTKVDLSSLIDALCTLAGEEFKAEYEQNLTIINNDQFRFLCRNAVPVQAHIAINSSTKTVVPGALWYEESLPPETLMYCCLTCSGARSDSGETAINMLKLLEDEFATKPFMQVGGNLTTGMGWFRVNWGGAEV